MFAGDRWEVISHGDAYNDEAVEAWRLTQGAKTGEEKGEKVEEGKKGGAK